MMLFDSFGYAAFFLAVFCLYWFLRRKTAQNVLLLIAGYVFYGLWSWKFLLLLCFSTLLDFSCGLLIDAAPTTRRRRVCVVASACINLGLLGFFKYYGFFASEAARLLTALGLQPHLAVLHIVLPLGISFYTFQSLGYVIDVYRGKVSAERNLLSYAVFVAFFPQLVAGPIERAGHMLAQVKSARTWSGVAIESGLSLMAWGLFKKMVIADNLAPYVEAVYSNPAHYSASTLLSATVFFALQIYCDLSGYTDIARGTARTLGFDLLQNFNLPYFSRSPVEFWRRWHMSLSQWFHDYLYSPLATHYVRKGHPGGKLFALLISMALLGVWHGANWTFLAFGIYWGVIIAGYLYVSQKITDASEHSPVIRLGNTALLQQFKPALSVAAMFVIACVGWMLFRARSLAEFWTVLSGVFGTAGGEVGVNRADILDVRLLWALGLGMWLAELVSSHSQRLTQLLTGGNLRRLFWRYALLCAIVFSYAVAQHGRAQPFIYFPILNVA
jgi:D-alanyl-lipoteichoic acid acyltransferase DltB (MBOAT superfamily)